MRRRIESALGGLHPPGNEEELGIYFKQKNDMIQFDFPQVTLAAVW